MLWSDNMVIPVGAPNPTAAYAFMNYVYDAGEPGPDRRLQQLHRRRSTGVKQIFEKTDPELAKSQLIFPSEAYHGELLDPARPAEAAGRLRSSGRSRRCVTGG